MQQALAQAAASWARGRRPRSRAQAMGAARGIIRALHAVRGRWRRPRRAPLALARCRPWCVRYSRAAPSHAPALGSRVPATCRMREPHWPRRLTRCSAGPALRNVGRCSMAASSSDAPLPVLPPAPHATESRAAPSGGPAVVLAYALQTNSWSPLR